MKAVSLCGVGLLLVEEGGGGGSYFQLPILSSYECLIGGALIENVMGLNFVLYIMSGITVWCSLPLGLATIIILIILLVLRYLFSSRWRIGRILLSKDGQGIFNMRNNLRAGCAHEGETGIDESAQALTRKN